MMDYVFLGYWIEDNLFEFFLVFIDVIIIGLGICVFLYYFLLSVNLLL